MSGDQHHTELPYARSWIDGLVQWIGRLPVPAWLSYALALLGFALLNNAVFWLDGSLPPSSFSRVRVTDSGYTVFSVAFYHT